MASSRRLKLSGKSDREQNGRNRKRRRRSGYQLRYVTTAGGRIARKYNDRGVIEHSDSAVDYWAAIIAITEPNRREKEKEEERERRSMMIVAGPRKDQDKVTSSSNKPSKYQSKGSL
ncbi:hypothetical protein HPP92_029041 [Vanilla planifolia]|uniref:Uncharacterized protein n=1 Tax=Vanilla planifolia TaxID=51239 RepID=A0A835P540_VANPL|nr:hypothetical protein HPP92_029041 [Vanilla planifolia]KAG0446033.1 hypothetical protein HPP92_029029 [Vanilla planifolia]